MTRLALPFPLRTIMQRERPLANMGAPMGRNRKERITATILGPRSGSVQCPMLRFVGLRFGVDVDPVEAAYAALARSGAASPEELRRQFVLPPRPCVVMPSLRQPELEVGTTSDDEILAEALILGLCGKTVYDPTRPVIWTRSSLSRRLEMFQTRGFYALD